ncbi:Formate/nitrite transporter-domain-containing protein [Dipodascopsis tothii]|uniref:Formate/nitrite transporter-domain-containing protein n=1 Tax=Dipodascopsis tothii TaxID=44089 RepID=UPI0034CD6C01
MADTITADEVAFQLVTIGSLKASQRLDHMIIKNFLGGALVSVGGMLTLLVKGGCQGLAENNPGLVQLLLGLVFPIGLVMSTLTGGELSTGNVLFLTVALMQRKVAWWRAIKLFVVSWLGNLAGSLFYIIIVHFGDIITQEPYASGTIELVKEKVLSPSWVNVFVRAIGCNWLICLAVYMSFLSKTVVSKVLTVYIPIFTFVVVGFDNSVANMFLIPIGMINGADLSVGKFIWKSLVPSTLGNIIGGSVFVGMFYWYLYVLEIQTVKTGPILPVTETGDQSIPCGMAPAQPIAASTAKHTHAHHMANLSNSALATAADGRGDHASDGTVGDSDSLRSSAFNNALTHIGKME